ncbi:hypothetical protein PF005_g18366 [Phytophthora fragariae]|uniref:Uncharacterized protein n=1 Tax=Phytophthora fragariae TaxID=53985 RepID=A0A6A3WXY4_9STRA|nr:hypothetical protein PF005_g18366 [Phytophthora fragariae]KAE9210381.1 hypothetical protein PF002_g18833 [Phytophthora fragariae]
MPPCTVAPQSAALRRGAPFADTLSNAVLRLVSPWVSARRVLSAEELRMGGRERICMSQ